MCLPYALWVGRIVSLYHMAVERAIKLYGPHTVQWSGHLYGLLQNWVAAVRLSWLPSGLSGSSGVRLSALNAFVRTACAGVIDSNPATAATALFRVSYTVFGILRLSDGRSDTQQNHEFWRPSLTGKTNVMLFCSRITHSLFMGLRRQQQYRVAQNVRLTFAESSFEGHGHLVVLDKKKY